MSIKSTFGFGLKAILLSIVYLICFAIASGITIMPILRGQPQQAQAGESALGLLIVAVLNVLALAYPILRSRWNGWRLTLTIFFVYYGVHTFMSQIETAAFLREGVHLPPGLLPALFAMGLILAATFSPLAVIILGKWKRDSAENEVSPRLVMPASEWTWKLLAIAGIYLILYFSFGYYVAWRVPEVQAYYGGSDPGSFIAQMGNVLRDTPWLPFFQILRALLWTLLALPVIRMMKGRSWETMLAVALLYTVPMNAALLLPNPIMPEAVRHAHLVETATANFIFGLFVAGLLLWRASRDLTCSN